MYSLSVTDDENVKLSPPRPLLSGSMHLLALPLIIFTSTAIQTTLTRIHIDSGRLQLLIRNKLCRAYASLSFIHYVMLKKNRNKCVYYWRNGNRPHCYRAQLYAPHGGILFKRRLFLFMLSMPRASRFPTCFFSRCRRKKGKCCTKRPHCIWKRFIDQILRIFGVKDAGILHALCLGDPIVLHW